MARKIHHLIHEMFLAKAQRGRYQHYVLCSNKKSIQARKGTIGLAALRA
jgi:hypothetical protein